ncbi:putative phosphoketolase [Zalerion maritima]|uniref:Phosphoketolase n=1 Tax=Zalerion maritima TaxID=339359 RepID=A0AAD5RV74_9PEZI|nr:putative phosphoketolase [Zalerion maritima]
MTGQIIDEPNPPALPSQLDDSILNLAAKVEKAKLGDDDMKSLKEFRRAACYIAAAMIFLKHNTLLEEPLVLEHVKPRLLGHWGTCPGIILVWSHLNLLIRNHGTDMMFVIGPGHGAPAALATLWLEGSLEKFYPDEYPQTKQGLHNVISRFSVSGGFPSHINAETPGAIHEGGELGYALAVSFGAVMDNPNLIVPCIVGDGEAESGPTATAWHAIKYLDPKESGAVLPILHLNGFKISERTIFGCMDDKELITLFTGYGYQVRIVDEMSDIDRNLAGAMEWALQEIRHIQGAARKDKPIAKPRWPMIILKTPKGWTGPKEVDGEIIEGSFRSHQIPIKAANKNPEHLKMLGDWLSSYNVNKLLPNGKPVRDILAIIPKDDSKKLGQIKASYDCYNPLNLPDWRPFTVESGAHASAMKVLGEYLAEIARQNPNDFRMFCPDELESNKLDAILKHTGRNFQWDPHSRARGGRVIEMLSEHTMQGFLQGYTLTGRTGLFPSYESFLGIVHTMMVQYSKFVKIAREVPWRKEMSSINYVETSTWARQEHNGFSHQNPSFIGAVLNLKPSAARVYLPPDANCMVETMNHVLRSKGYVNLVVGSKQETAVWLSKEDAAEHCKKGASVWKFASCEGEPDVILVGIGVEVTFEVVKAAELLKELAPELKVRVVNVTDLMVLNEQDLHPHSLTKEAFKELFTEDKPVIFNYHGYPTELRGLLFGRPGVHRMKVSGYMEEGSTTTPFDMMAVNRVSRFDVASQAIEWGDVEGKEKLIADIDNNLKATKEFIEKEGRDPDDIYDMPKF